MQQQYRTDESNQVHQLTVCVSRHLYVTASGKLKHQKKAFDAKIEREASFSKRHIVHYLVRDHFSGMFYAEVSDTLNIYPVIDFLHRAWSPKETHPLQGLPFGLTVSKPVRSLWPEIERLLDHYSIQPIAVTSGFQGGVRDLRTWEEHLRCGLYSTGYPPDFSEVLEHAPHECRRIQQYDYRGEPKAIKWTKGLPEEIWLPGTEADFHGAAYGT